MMYLSGAKNPIIGPELAAGTIGFLRTPYGGHSLDGVAVWALDNGCFTNAYPGDDQYLALLDQLVGHRDRCLFVAAPDVVGDAPATLALFPPMAARIRAAGWPVALVGQDGMELLPVPWDLVDWLFVGGGTAWKCDGAFTLIRQARDHDKKIHIGRINSGRRWRMFASVADTCDGTFLAFAPDINAHHIRRWASEAIHDHLPMETR